MNTFNSKETPSDEPPSYEQSEASQLTGNGEQTPQYSGNNGPSEYPDEKSKEGDFFSDVSQQNWQDPSSHQKQNIAPGGGHAQPPPGTYTLPPQKVNIAYETDGRNTRPGYADYVRRDNERISQGDAPKPREAFRHGAPLAPSKKGQGSGGFPGASGPTYYGSSSK
ncbi:hypothetical protein OXX59_004474 [Metschnikowia pulcherrima]